MTLFYFPQFIIFVLYVLSIYSFVFSLLHVLCVAVFSLTLVLCATDLFPWILCKLLYNIYNNDTEATILKTRQGTFCFVNTFAFDTFWEFSVELKLGIYVYFNLFIEWHWYFCFSKYFEYFLHHCVCNTEVKESCFW